jgi:hypothetical protein
MAERRQLVVYAAAYEAVGGSDLGAFEDEFPSEHVFVEVLLTYPSPP